MIAARYAGVMPGPWKLDGLRVFEAMRQRMEMRKSFLLLALFVASSNVAAEWVVVGSDENKTIYADPASRVKNGSLVEMWGIFDFKTTHTSDVVKAYKSLKFRDEFDCDQKQSRNLNIAIHTESMAEGELASSYADPSKWQSVSGLRESLWRIACDSK